MTVGITKVMNISRQPATRKIDTNAECGMGSQMINNARCTGEIKSITAMVETTFNKKKTLFTTTLD